LRLSDKSGSLDDKDIVWQLPGRLVPRAAENRSRARSHSPRRISTLAAALADKLLDGEKSHVLSARLTEALGAAAKERAGITLDTKLIEPALASLAVGDNFGEWLIAQGGRLPADFDVDL